MESSSKLKTFECPSHKGETVQRFSTDPSTKKMLYCIDCLMDVDKNAKTYLLDIKSLPDHIAKSLSSTSQAFKINSDAPESLTEVIDSSDSHYEKMTNHILKQKDKAVKVFKELQDDFLEKLEAAKKKILYDLDCQLATYKRNLEDYRAKLSKSFNYGRRSEEEAMKPETVIEEFNKCQDHFEIESKLMSWLIRIKEDKKLKKEDEQEIAIIESLKAHKSAILKSVEKLPECNYNFESTISHDRVNFNKYLDIYLRTLGMFKNKVLPFRFSKYSSEIAEVEDFEFIYKKINSMAPLQSFKASLILKTKNNAEDFKLVDVLRQYYKNPHVLLIIRKPSETLAIYREGCFHATNTKFSTMNNGGINTTRIVNFNLSLKTCSDNSHYNIYINMQYGDTYHLSDSCFINPRTIDSIKNRAGLVSQDFMELDFELFQIDFEGKKEYTVDEKYFG